MQRTPTLVLLAVLWFAAMLLPAPRAAGQCAFTQQPVGTGACPGRTVEFRVTAILATSYQWLKDGTPLANGIGVSGATTPTLTLTDIDEADQGNYQCRATGAFANCLSDSAFLGVHDPARVVQSPADTSVCAGQTVTFAVVVTSGLPVTYQWKRNNVDLHDGSGVTGATTSTLVLSAVDAADRGMYHCSIDSGCNAASSIPADLGVSIPVSILAQPGSIARCVGQSASISITINADATSPHYQWRRGTTNLANVGNIAGAYSSTLTINPLTLGDSVSNYNCVVSNVCNTVTSNNTAITVDSPVAITGITAAQTACTADTIYKTVTTTGSTPITYQWRRNGVNLIESSQFIGVNSASLSIHHPVVGSAGTYTCVVGNACASNVISAGSPLIVNERVTITDQPDNAAVCLGGTATFTIAATGTAPMTYAWLKWGVALEDGAGISGTRTPTLTIANVQSGNDMYQCVIGNACGEVFSSSAALTLATATAVTAQPLGAQVTLPTGYSFTTTAVGTGTLAYQWRRNNVGLSNGGRFSGVNTATLTVSSSTSDDYAAAYDCIITGTCGSTITGKAGVYLCTFSEMEPNDSKTAANSLSLSPGQTLCGTSNATTPADYFRLNLPLTPGITRYNLSLVSNSGHIISLRAMSQTNGVINAGSDLVSIAGSATPGGQNSVQWFACGTTPPSLFFAVYHANATTPNYAVRLSATAVPIENAPSGSGPPGPMTITGYGAIDTDIWVYDRDLNPIPTFGNDDDPGPPEIYPSRLTRTYAPGVYYLALGHHDLVNNQPRAADDAWNGAVADFPGAVWNSYSGVTSLGAVLRGTPILPVPVNGHEIRWIRFAVSCNPADVAGLGGSGSPDGTLTPDDIIYFLDQFFANNLAVVDIVGLGGPPNPPDGRVTADDLIYFLNQFFAGCP